MTPFRRNLPNEHGAWVLLIVGLIVGVAANPGWWQTGAVAGWLGLFFSRVPLTRWLDGHRGVAESGFVLATGAVAVVSFGLLCWVAPLSSAWAGVATLPGLTLLLFRRRKFMRSIVGELLSALAITPLIPSVAAAGGATVTSSETIVLGAAMAIYLVASILRVRAVARTGRHQASVGVAAAGVVMLPVLALIAWHTGFWSPIIAWACLPAISIGVALACVTYYRRLPIQVVGIWEIVAVVPFVVGLLIDVRY